MPKPSKVSKPAKSTSTGTKSLADLWDDTDETEASNFIPPGSDHEVRINSMELKKDPKKGTAVIGQLEVIDGEHEGKTGRQMYKLTDGSGNKAPGMAYLKRDMKLLGYEDVSGKKLEKALKEISDEQPMIVVNAKQNGQYTNYYIQGLVDDSGLASGKETSDDNSDITEGDTIKWDDDGTERTGKVTKINAKKEVYTAEDKDGDEYKVDFADAEKADEEAGTEGGATDADGDPIIDVGSQVKWEGKKGQEFTGKVKSINAKKGTAVVTDDDGDDNTLDVDDLELVSGDGADEPELEVGDDVEWKEDGEDMTGEIVKVKDDQAKVKDAENKFFWVDLDDLTKA